MNDYEIIQGIKFRISRQGTEVIDCENMVFNTNFGKDIKYDRDTVGKYADFNYAKRVKIRAQKVREICKNNFEAGKAMFVTLTFDPKRFDSDSLNILAFTHGEFKKFIKRVNGHFEGFKYIATFARQSNGNWHYHMMCNLCSSKDKKTLAALWDGGYISCTLINSEKYYYNCIGYLIKNMNRSASDLKRIRGYLFSRNTERDMVVTSWRAEDVSEYDNIKQDIMQSKVYKKYEINHHIGIKSTTIDTDTGEVEEHIMINSELYAKDIKQGTVDVNTKYIYYGSDKKYEDSFKPIETATVKTTKHKKKKSKSKKK